MFVVVCAGAVAACGSGGAVVAATTTGAGRGPPVRFAQCMRTHGVANFPDPETPSQVSPNTDVLIEGGMVFPIGSAIDPDSPAFKRAGAVCGGPAAGGQPKGG